MARSVEERLELDPSADACQHGRSDFGLESVDLVRHGRLGVSEQSRGPRDGLLAGNGLERPQPFEVESWLALIHKGNLNKSLEDRICAYVRSLAG